MLYKHGTFLIDWECACIIILSYTRTVYLTVDWEAVN